MEVQEDSAGAGHDLRASKIDTIEKSVHMEVPDYSLLAENRSGKEIKYACREGHKKKCIIITGHSGSGKTTLLRDIFHCWVRKEVFQDVTVVLWWDLSKSDHSQVESIKELVLIQDSALQHDIMLRETQENGGKNTLVMIDTFTKRTKFASQLLTKQILPECSILIAARYSSVNTLTTSITDYDLFEMKGLKTEHVHEVMLRKGQELKLRSIDRLIDYVRSDPNLLDFCRTPSIISLVCEVFKTNRYQCPKTTTSLIKSIVDKMVIKSLDSGSTVPSESEEHLQCICSLAFQTHLQKEYDRYEFSCLSTIHCISGARTQIGMGLMQILNDNGRITCNFVHRTVQAYLAALHIQNQPSFDQAYMCLDLTQQNNYEMLLTFFCGIAHSQSPQSPSLNIAKMVLYPLLESIADKLLLEEDPAQRKLIFLLECLHEAQDPNLTRKILTRRRHLLTLTLQDHMQSEPKLQMLAYCIAHSGINEWRVEIFPEKLYLTDFLEMLIMDQLSSELKSKFVLEVARGHSFQISTYRATSLPPVVKSKSNVYSRIVRELLHRLLQLHSPIKLKSDGSNTSYVSILACECLKCEMENNRILCLEPIAATHWLPMKPKDKSSSQHNEVTQTLLHMKQHGGQHVEFVMMMMPFPHRIRFLMPVTKEVITIELSSCSSPDFLSDGINDRLICGARLTAIREEVNFNANFQKLILPCMPLPKQSNSKALTLAPQIPESQRMRNTQPQALSEYREPTEIPVADTTPTQNNTTNRCEVSCHDQNRHRHQLEPIRACGSPFHNTNGSMLNFEQSAQQSQFSQSQRQASMKPGVIIHTVIPKVFATDQQYPLPDESHLVRKGGNGEIFLVTFSSMQMIVKKTSYRNREFLIHSKLRHANIIQLLSMMMGERDQSQCKKLVCYHFLPKATGDLARLAVDDKKNTLKNIKMMYGNNPKEFGLILGNLKYTLRQVLNGLVYLHGLNVVHRDIKASNILLTFYCSCSNPLMCSCTKKCAVQIADFDSAIQLTKDGLLPPTKLDQRRHKFTVVPVGTCGYRPPESSQLIVSNDISIITPSLSTKADVWSFGVLMLKMVAGHYGPASQREVSQSIHVACT